MPTLKNEAKTSLKKLLKVEVLIKTLFMTRGIKNRILAAEKIDKLLMLFLTDTVCT